MPGCSSQGPATQHLLQPPPSLASPPYAWGSPRSSLSTAHLVRSQLVRKEPPPPPRLETAPPSCDVCTTSKSKFSQTGGWNSAKAGLFTPQRLAKSPGVASRWLGTYQQIPAPPIPPSCKAVVLSGGQCSEPGGTRLEGVRKAMAAGWEGQTSRPEGQTDVPSGKETDPGRQCAWLSPGLPLSSGRACRPPRVLAGDKALPVQGHPSFADIPKAFLCAKGQERFCSRGLRLKVLLAKSCM